jgi:pyruvate/2-oxoglutarate/acetoin dehydrogenase E1 component
MGNVPKTLRETIKDITRTHLTEKNGLAMGQCLTAVGWVGGTLPELYEDKGMVELSMADVAGGGFAVGAALSGRRPMYIIRYQGFNWFNAPIIVNYACKSKEIWNVPCPMFIRSIAMEGAIGPVAGSSHHSIYYRMPGVVIRSPMTPKEYINCYENFMKSDDVYYVSEHRGAYGNSEELEDIELNEADLCLFPISITRFPAMKAAENLGKKGIKVSVHHIESIKPFVVSQKAIQNLKQASVGLVLDDDFTNGVAKSIAFDLGKTAGARMDVLGLLDRTAGFDKKVDNLPPNEIDIEKKVIDILSRKDSKND